MCMYDRIDFYSVAAVATGLVNPSYGGKGGDKGEALDGLCGEVLREN